MTVHPELRRTALRVRRPLLAATLLLAAATLTHLVQAALLATALADLARGSAARLTPLLGAVAAVVAVRAVLTTAQRTTAARAGARARVAVRDELLARLGRLGHAHPAAARTGGVRTTLVDGVEGTDAYISRYLPQLLVTLTVPPLVLAVVAAVEPLALIGLVPALVLALTGPRLWDRLLARRGREHWDTYEALGADYLEALQGMPALRAAGATGRVRTRLEHRSAALHRATVAKLRVSLADTGITDLAVQGGTAAAVLLACHAAATGSAPATTTYLVLLLASECFRPVRDLAREWHAGYLGTSAAGPIAALRTARPAVTDDGTAPARWPQPPELRFEHLTFTHEGAPAPALHDVTFTAEAGRTTAIVGPSGAGKTTLLTLLLRHHDPGSGRITLDGRPVAGYTLGSLRRAIAVVSQETYLFHGTITDNLRLARPDATDGDLTAAARAAGVLDEITALPDGWNTVLGERGSTLSGGQRQRLALARALLTDAPVLVLDEATSSVDENREARIVRDLATAARGRTVLVVAHRLSAVRHADRIVVLDGGRVDAVGDHPTLLAAGGLYGELAAGLREGLAA
jgi:ATP-binding cassette, subfamily C, bacterial CydD